MLAFNRNKTEDYCSWNKAMLWMYESKQFFYSMYHSQTSSNSGVFEKSLHSSYFKWGARDPISWAKPSIVLIASFIAGRGLADSTAALPTREDALLKLFPAVQLHQRNFKAIHIHNHKRKKTAQNYARRFWLSAKSGTSSVFMLCALQDLRRASPQTAQNEHPLRYLQLGINWYWCANSFQ